MEWSPIAVEHLKRLYREGATYTEIAVALQPHHPGVTREAIGGKAKRLKLRTRSGKERITNPRSHRKPRGKSRVVHHIPAHTPPTVRFLFEEMVRQQKTQLEVATDAGLKYSTLGLWKRRTAPRLQDIEACFNVLGLTLQPVPL